MTEIDSPWARKMERRRRLANLSIAALAVRSGVNRNRLQVTLRGLNDDERSAVERALDVWRGGGEVVAS